MTISTPPQICTPKQPAAAMEDAKQGNGLEPRMISRRTELAT